MECKFCGSQLSENARHCSLCGNSVNAVIDQRTLYAPQKVEEQSEKEEKIEYYTSYKVAIWVVRILSTAVDFVLFGFIINWGFAPEMSLVIIPLLFAFSVLYTNLYFLPYRIAAKKKHNQTRAIYLLNIFTAWFLILWFVALIWANTNSSKTVVVNNSEKLSGSDEILKYKKLLDDGIITEEEFNAKKKQLMGI